MLNELIIVIVAAGIAVLAGAAAVVRKGDAIASWCFLAGMVLLAADVLFGTFAMRAPEIGGQKMWFAAQFAAKSLLPAVWLCFSLTYCRGNSREFLARWRWMLGVAFVVPPAVALGFHADLVGGSLPDGRVAGSWVPVQAFTVLQLLFCVLVLVNLEKTFRAAVGTLRWRIKYLFIGAGLVFGVRIYTLSQALLFSGFKPSMTMVDAVALLLGSSLIAIAYVRRGFGALDLYPSRTVLQGSLTIVLVGAYLVVVGVLAQVVSALGVPEGFPAKAFIVLVGIVGLTVLLLSDRVRTKLRRQVIRHFHRPQHDSRAIWTKFTRSSFGVMDRDCLCRSASEVISGAFHVLTIRILLLEPDGSTLTLVTSTYDGEAREDVEESGISATLEMREELGRLEHAFDLDGAGEEWIADLCMSCPNQFPNGGRRVGVPLRAAERLLGVMVLADRVDGIAYTQEERDLLICLGDQLAAGLLNLTLSEEQMQSKELEAFQTMSTFFVHDLKNAANSIGLMLQNLPTHFDDPEFRKDTLRGLGAAVDRINNMIAKLGTLRSRLQPELEDCDINQLVRVTLHDLGCNYAVVTDLQPVPKVQADHEQLRSVLTNLVTNAAEASGSGAEVQVQTARQNGHLLLEVADQGSGMSREFIKDSLFRPFVSTKSKGLGIGMFQSRMIVEAHRGTIDVQSEPGQGTRVRIALPIN